MKKIIGVLGGVVVTALAAGTFAIGARLGPDRSIGKNLYRPHQSLVQVSSTSLVIPASFTTNAHGTQVASAATDSSDSEQSSDDFTADGPGATFEEVYVLLKHNYVDGVPTDTRLGHGAAAAMINSLADPDSRFLEEPEMREMQSEQKGIYHGIGAVTAIREVKHDGADSDENYTQFNLTIVAPLSGTPAEKAGLKAGDIITHVNGHWVASYDPVAANEKKLKDAQDDPVTFNNLVADIQKQTDNSITITEAEAKLDDVTLPPDLDPTDKSTQDKPSPTLALTVERPGAAQPLQINVPVDQTTDVPPVVSRTLPDNVGYLHITQFDDSTSKAVESALNGFGNDLKGLVVDLRNTPGGDLDAAADVDGQLGGAKFLGLVEGKGKNTKEIAVKSSRIVNCPIVVLVNGGTANTAELLAASLHDQGYKLVGEKTFGDGMEVAPVTLRDGAGFTMTVGQFYTLSHKPFNDTGLTPDLQVPSVGPGDEQLNQAITALSGRVANGPTVSG